VAWTDAAVKDGVGKAVKMFGEATARQGGKGIKSPRYKK